MQGRLRGPSPLLSTLPPLQLIAITLWFCSHGWWWECLCPSQWMNLRRREVPHGSTAAWELAGREGKVSSSQQLCSLLDVLEKCSSGIHHSFEGIFTSRSHALIRVEQHSQLSVGFVHFISRR